MYCQNTSASVRKHLQREFAHEREFELFQQSQCGGYIEAIQLAGLQIVIREFIIAL